MIEESGEKEIKIKSFYERLLFISHYFKDEFEE